MNLLIPATTFPGWGEQLFNNFGYAAAGLLAGRVTGSTWEEQLRERLLEPLGMRRSNVTVDSALALADHATGYRVVRPDSGEVRVQPMDHFRIDVMAPAGAIDDFTSLMAVLPDDDLGVVVLSNRLGSAFTRAVTLTAVDRMLDLEARDWTGRFRKQAEQSRQATGSGSADTAAAAPPSHPLSEYAGVYRHPAYGPMRVSSAGDSLVVRLGTMTIDRDHRHYDVFDGRASNPLLQELSFAFQIETNRSGDVAALTTPLEPSAEPLRLERQAPERLRDPDFLEGLAPTGWRAWRWRSASAASGRLSATAASHMLTADFSSRRR